MNPAVQTMLIVMQKERKEFKLPLLERRSNVLVQIVRLGRLRVKLKDTLNVSLGKLRWQTVFGDIAAHVPVETIQRHFLPASARRASCVISRA